MTIRLDNISSVCAGITYFACLACDLTVNEVTEREEPAATTAMSHDAGDIHTADSEGDTSTPDTAEDTTAETAAETAADTTSDAGTPPAKDLAKAAFWNAFTQERYEEAAAVTEELERALEQDPSDAESSLLLAHSYLWRLSELGRNPAADPSEIPGLAFGAQAAFEYASALAPEDSRIWGWLGSVLVGNGHVTGNGEVLEAGLALIDQGVEVNVEFNGFVLALAHYTAPVDSDEFELASDAMWASIEACAGFSVERDDPDLARVVEAVYSEDAPQVCRSGPKAAHGLEGFLLFFGDLLTKAGDGDGARAMFAATRLVPSFETWPYRFLTEERENDLERRLAAYDTADPADDPRFVSDEPYNCSYCHAASVRQ